MSSESHQQNNLEEYKSEVREIKERMGRRPTKHTVGEMPYIMVYGTELVIPVEIGMPSFRTSNFDKENNETKLRLNFDLLDKKRE